MPKVTQIGSRKNDHIRINLEKDTRSGLTTGLEFYHFRHRAAPEIDFNQVDLSQELFGRRLKLPILVSSMTGGTDEAGEINRILALAAQHSGIAMGLGSQRAAIEHPELSASYQIRKYAPDILLLANLGAIQLNYGYSVAECMKAVEMAGADALVLHFNPLQEAVQPEGNTHFGDLLAKVEKVCRTLPVPVIAKEVGWGFSETDVKNLVNAGVAAIDVAGAGGTSWSQVEMHRAQSESQALLASAFVDWGIPTAEAVKIACQAAPGLPVIASGGLRSGVDIAKCIALGARLGGMAAPFLEAVVQSLEKSLETIDRIAREIQIAMFAAGVKDIQQLRQTPLVKIERGT
jgi:isopentenyl-diphosphate delta-isomerase